MEDEIQADLEFYKAAYEKTKTDLESANTLKKYYRDQVRYLKEQNQILQDRLKK
jgi:hypothetical protein